MEAVRRLLPVVKALALLIFALSLGATPALALASARERLVIPEFESPSNPNTWDVSADGVQLADALQLTARLKHLQELRRQVAACMPQKAPAELRQDLTDERVDVMAAIQQTRLEIDFVVAELEAEEAIYEEVLRKYTIERDARVNKANLWAFRSNGALWAVAEALTIPTYNNPKLSIPSGTIGIVAGLVPSFFSAFAVRSSGGLHHERASYPNMLSKLYDFPTTPRIEFPNSVWMHLNAIPAGGHMTRRELLLDHWKHIRNVRLLMGASRLQQLTGANQRGIDIDILSDRLTMMRELKAAVLEMTRPLLEIDLVLQGKKALP